MKKAVALLLPLTVLLASCQLKIGHTSDQYSAGLSNGEILSSYNNYVEKSYEYFSGDDVETTGSSVAHVTFNVSETISSLDKDVKNKVSNIINCDLDSLTVNVDETYNVGADEDSGLLFIGADSTYVDGYLTLSFTSYIKAAIIEACPYYYDTNAWNEDQFFVDSNVAIAINSSRYVKLSSTRKDNENDIISTECRYNLGNDVNQLKIKVGQRRAFIRRITLYL